MNGRDSAEIGEEAQALAPSPYSTRVQHRSPLQSSGTCMFVFSCLAVLLQRCASRTPPVLLRFVLVLVLLLVLLPLPLPLLSPLLKVESANIGKAAPKPEFLDEEAEQGDGRLKEEGEAQSGESGDEVHIPTWGSNDDDYYIVGVTTRCLVALVAARHGLNVPYSSAPVGVLNLKLSQPRRRYCGFSVKCKLEFCRCVLRGYGMIGANRGISESVSSGKKLTKLSRLIPPQENEDDSWTGPVDKDGFPVGRTPDDKKKIEALPPVDHSQIEVRNGERWMRQA